MPHTNVTVPDSFPVVVTKINETWTIKVHESEIVDSVRFAVKQRIANSHAAITRDKFRTESEWLAAVRFAAQTVADKYAAGTIGEKGDDTARAKARQYDELMADPKVRAHIESLLAKKNAA